MEKILTPAQVAPVLGSNPHTMRLTVQQRGLDAYPFPMYWSGNRLKIPAKPFVEWAKKTGLM